MEELGPDISEQSVRGLLISKEYLDILNVVGKGKKNFKS